MCCVMLGLGCPRLSLLDVLTTVHQLKVIERTGRCLLSLHEFLFPITWSPGNYWFWLLTAATLMGSLSLQEYFLLIILVPIGSCLGEVQINSLSLIHQRTGCGVDQQVSAEPTQVLPLHHSGPLGSVGVSY